MWVLINTVWKTMLMQNIVGETDCNVDRDWRCRMKKTQGSKANGKNYIMTNDTWVIGVCSNVNSFSFYP